MSTPQGVEEVFTCGCGKTYKTRGNLTSHQRRHCRLNREDLNVENEGQCPICDRIFATYMGMRQHMRITHSSEYNDRLQEESATARQMWTEDEENALARAEAEAELMGANIMEVLLSVSTRSKDAIKKRRHTPRYAEKVRKHREELLLRRQQMAALEADENSPHQLRQQQTAEQNDIYRRDGELVEAITCIPAEKLEGADVELRRKLISSAKLDVVAEFELWCESLMSSHRKSKNRRPSQQQMSPAEVLRSKLADNSLSKRRKRALQYKLAKIEYARDKNAYARTLLDGIDHAAVKERPSSQAIEEYYKNVFELLSPPDDELITDKRREVADISSPITEAEVTDALKSTKSNTPGPDGVTLEDARRIPVHRLLLMFNTILYLEYIPRCFRMSRTVLIPKSVEDGRLCKNWRPITISAILLRLLNKIIAKRLGTLKMCDQQRGFSKIDGCFANFASVETIINHYRKNAKPLSIISLDLAKAFDSVSHNSIARAITRLNIDLKAKNIIAENYKAQRTSIVCGGEDICVCKINRGVKQGDPMSPILFNAVIDELLVQLEETYSGIAIGSAKATCLAYADDLVLFANTQSDAQRMLDHCIRFFKKRGLELNAAKCRSIVLKVVPGKKKLFVPTESVFEAEGDSIPPVGIGDEFRYLGQMFNTEGLTECTAEKLVEQLKRIRHAPLKPHQKYTIIRDHLIPRYIAVLQRPNVAKQVLKRMDRCIRSALKQILHLNVHCSNALFYAPIKSGGLGIFEFSKMIPIITLSRWDRVKDWSELLQETYRLSESWINRYRRMIQSGVNTKEAVKRQQEQGLQNSFSGGGIFQVKHHPACNDYIWRAPNYWSGQDFIKAVQLRFNLLPCQGIPSNPVNQRRCRAGCFRTESLSHILQRCPLVHRWRIQRHDYVVRRLSNFARRRKWRVQVEPRIRCTDGSLKKPDLILEKDETVIVTDVGIHWEGPENLTAQYFNKSAIYSTEVFVNKLLMMYPDKNIFILPIIIGARGAWCKKNESIAQHLELSRSQIADLITTTIRGSCIIHKQFMRCVWRERPTGRRHSNR